MLQLAPDSALERESLQRLRTMVADNKVSGFHFDDSELFPDATPAAPPTPAEATATAAAIAAASEPAGARAPLPVSSGGIPVTEAEVAAMPAASAKPAQSALVAPAAPMPGGGCLAVPLPSPRLLRRQW